MLVATFGPSTGWVGKTITREGDVFTLEGHGPITAADVMEYDRQGHLVWMDDATRAWCESKAQALYARQIGVDAAVAETPRDGGSASKLMGSAVATPPRTRSRLPGVIVVGLLIAIAIAIGIPMFQAQRANSKTAAVDEGVHTVRVAIMMYAVDHDDAYPDPFLVSSSGLAAFTDEWPTNPYTGAPMKQGSRPGDFRYSLAADGMSFALIGYGGAEASGLSRDDAVQALESTYTYGDGVWGQMPGTSMEMIAVKVPADSDTGNMDYWVRSRMDSSSEWSEGMFYGSADQAVDALVSGAQIERFSPWVGDAVQEP